MGIYREGYRHYTGSLLSPKSRYLVLAAHEFGQLMSRRWTKRLLYLAILPLAVTVITLLARMAEQAVSFSAESISNEVFNGMLVAELHIAALLAAVAGAGSVADDRRSKALVLYLSRPLSPFRYLLAKGLALGGLLAAVMVIPALAYVAADSMVAKNVDTEALLAHLFTALVPTLAVAVAFASTTVLLSSFASRSAYVSMGWLALFYGSGMVVGLVTLADGSLEWVKMLSLPNIGMQMVGWALKSTSGPEPWIAWAIWMALVGLGWWRRTLALRSLAVTA